MTKAELNQLALQALKNNQRQLDQDGVEVGVSRQALDELIVAYEAAVALSRTPGEAGFFAGLSPEQKERALAYRGPEDHGAPGEAVAWLWYGEDGDGKQHTSFGRWQKHACQQRYKLAETQPTEHDHPAPAAPAGEIEARNRLFERLDKRLEGARQSAKHQGEPVERELDFATLTVSYNDLRAALASPAPGAIAPGVEEIAKVIHASKLLQPARGPWLGDNSVTEKFCMLAAADILAAIRSGEKAG